MLVLEQRYMMRLKKKNVPFFTVKLLPPKKIAKGRRNSNTHGLQGVSTIILSQGGFIGNAVFSRGGEGGAFRDLETKTCRTLLAQTPSKMLNSFDPWCYCHRCQRGGDTPEKRHHRWKTTRRDDNDKRLVRCAIDRPPCPAALHHRYKHSRCREAQLTS